MSFFSTRGKEPGRPLSPPARPAGPACEGATGGFFPPPDASDIVRPRAQRGLPRLPPGRPPPARGRSLAEERLGGRRDELAATAQARGRGGAPASLPGLMNYS